MVGALSMVGSSVMDSHAAGPCLFSDALPTSVKGGGELVLLRKRKKVIMSLGLGSSFVDSWDDWRLSSKLVLNKCPRKQKQKQRRDQRLLIVNEIAGQYEDSFEDVKAQILNYITYKAVRTVLNQLYEMNPTQYRWFYDFVASNKPGDGKRFIRILGKSNNLHSTRFLKFSGFVEEKHDLAERVMITRLHLYGKWIKKCDHAQIYKEISDENLELMRERLIETVIWPSDDSNTQKIG